jgi:hypothetical protein
MEKMEDDLKKNEKMKDNVKKKKKRKKTSKKDIGPTNLFLNGRQPQK